MKKISILAIACAFALHAHAMEYQPLTPWWMPDGTVQYKKAAFQIEEEERRAGRDPQKALDAHYREIGGIIGEAGQRGQLTGPQVADLQRLIKKARASHGKKREEAKGGEQEGTAAAEESGEDYSDLPTLLTPEEVAEIESKRKQAAQNTRRRQSPRNNFERTMARGFAAAISGEEGERAEQEQAIPEYEPEIQARPMSHKIFTRFYRSDEVDPHDPHQVEELLRVAAENIGALLLDDAIKRGWPEQ
jgi:hypothetical protein